MSASFILELKNISKNFGGVRALHNVDLNLSYNEILAVVGDNGAGQTAVTDRFSWSGVWLTNSGL